MLDSTRCVRRSRFVMIAAGVALLVCTVTGQALAVTTATLDIGPPTVTPSTATFDVFLTMPGTPPGDRIEGIGLSPFDSDPALTAGNTDFSRFSFAVDAGTLPTWFEGVPISTGLGLYIPADSVLGPFFDAGPQRRIGQLAVDLAGLAPDTEYTVTLAEVGGPLDMLQTDVFGNAEGNWLASFRANPGDTGELVFADPTGVTFRTSAFVIPEPVTMAGAVMGIFGVAGYLRRRKAC